MSVFVGNIPFGLSVEDFKAAFAHFGPIKSALIPTYRHYGQIRSEGHGFIDFETEEAKQKCLSSGETIVIEGRTVVYREAHPRPVCNDTIFVSNLPVSFTQTDLEDLVSEYNPTEVKLIRESDGEKEGFGYAKFASEAVRDRVIAALNNYDVNGMKILVRAASRPFTAEKPQRRRHYRY